MNNNFVGVSELLCLLITEYKRLVDNLKDRDELDENKKKKIYQRGISDYIRKNLMLSIKKKKNNIKIKQFNEKIKSLYKYYNIYMLPQQMQINYIRNILETRDYSRIYNNKDFLMYTESYVKPESNNMSQKTPQCLQLYNGLQYTLPDSIQQNKILQYLQNNILNFNPDDCKYCYEINNMLYFDGNSGIYYNVFVLIL